VKLEGKRGKRAGFIIYSEVEGVDFFSLLMRKKKGRLTSFQGVSGG